MFVELQKEFFCILGACRKRCLWGMIFDPSPSGYWLYRKQGLIGLMLIKDEIVISIDLPTHLMIKGNFKLRLAFNRRYDIDWSMLTSYFETNKLFTAIKKKSGLHKMGCISRGMREKSNFAISFWRLKSTKVTQL